MMGAQWLALAHGVLHARGLAPVAPVAVVDTGSPARAGWIERLLGRHDDSGTGCFSASDERRHHFGRVLQVAVHDHDPGAPRLGDAGDDKLYDQSAGGDHAPAVAVADLPALGAPSPAPRWVQRAWAARLVPHFSARAPPLAA